MNIRTANRIITTMEGMHLLEPEIRRKQEAILRQMEHFVENEPLQDKIIRVYDDNIKIDSLLKITDDLGQYLVVEYGMKDKILRARLERIRLYNLDYKLVLTDLSEEYRRYNELEKLNNKLEDFNKATSDFDALYDALFKVRPDFNCDKEVVEVSLKAAQD